MKKYLFYLVIVLIFSLSFVDAFEGLNIQDIRNYDLVKPMPIAINNQIDFIVHGDNHAGYDDAEPIHREIVQRIREYNPQIIFNTGDLVHGQWGGENNWNIFHNISGGLVRNYPYYPTIGNHDAAIGVEHYIGYFPHLPDDLGNDKYYYVEDGESIFIILDADSLSSGANSASLEEQQIWLDQVLNEFSDKTYKFVFFHRPGYTSGNRGAAMWTREFDSYFVDHEIDIVFGGHIHAYERFYIEGVHYLNTGGSGGVPHLLDEHHDYPFATRQYSEETYNYVTVSGDEESLLISARYPDGDVFDEFVIGPEIEYVSTPDEEFPLLKINDKRNLKFSFLASFLAFFKFNKK